MAVQDMRVEYVHQGQYSTAHRDNVVLSAVLGSCVATCLYDAAAHVGGMNHFLLPKSGDENSAHIRFGANSMEVLINALLKAGASRDRLCAKVFGGAQMAEHFGTIGRSNAQFATWFLEEENIPIKAQSLLGRQARRVMFWPATGRARQLLIGDDEAVLDPAPKPSEQKVADSGDLTLF